MKSYAFAECDKLKRITFAGVPSKLSRHTFDDCDQLHDIIVPAGSTKTFRKALHYIDGDTDFIVIEAAGKKEEVKIDSKKEEVKTDSKKDEKKDNKKTAPKKNQKKAQL